MRQIIYTALTLFTSLISANTLLAKNASSPPQKNTIANTSAVTPLSSFAKQLLTPNTTTLAPEKNIMFGILGLGAPLNQDPLSYAKAIVAFETEKTTKDKTPNQLLNPSNSELKWQGDINQLCHFSTENCFSKIKDQDPIYQTLAEQNKVVLARYQTLLTLDKSAHVMPVRINAAIPTYTLAGHANRLALHQIANELLSEKENERIAALAKLHTELKLWINLAKGEPSQIIEKFIALHIIHRHLHVIGEYTMQQAQLTLAERKKINDILKDLDQEQIWDVRSALHTEYKYLMNGMQDVNQELEKYFSAMPQSIVDEINQCPGHKRFTTQSLSYKFYNQYFDGNELINILAQQFQKQDQVLALPKPQQSLAWQKINRDVPNAAEFDKFSKAVQTNKCLLISNTKKINLYAKPLYDIASPNHFDYVQRANDHQAYFNLIRAVVTIKEKGLLPTQIARFLENNKSSYQHPATLANVEFNEKTQIFQIQPTGKHNPASSNFSLKWR